MKNLIAGFFVLFSFSCFSAEIAVVDIDFLFKNSKHGISMNKKIEKMNNDLIKDFNKEEKIFREEEQKIISKKNILSEMEYQKEVKNFEKKVREYNKKKQEKLKKLNKKKADEYAKLYEKISVVLIKYSKENKISTTFDKKNVIMTISENDITQKILEILNKS